MTGWRPWLSLLGRCFLGGTFVYASLDKLAHPRLFAAVIHELGVVPDRLVVLAALVLPWVELLAGGLLVAGLLSYSSAAVLGGLSLVFALVVGWAWIQGLAVPCGCFQLGESSSGIGWGHLAFDLALAAAALLVLLKGAGPLAVDSLLFGVREGVPATDGRRKTVDPLKD
ncbi:MAG: DoxX family membrane protein [Armatimonadetes bacterium]|nr:DoxX family membrane protein [Armatimonadota bacterium]